MFFRIVFVAPLFFSTKEEAIVPILFLTDLSEINSWKALFNSSFFEIEIQPFKAIKSMASVET